MEQRTNVQRQKRALYWKGFVFWNVQFSKFDDIMVRLHFVDNNQTFEQVLYKKVCAQCLVIVHIVKSHLWIQQRHKFRIGALQRQLPSLNSLKNWFFSFLNSLKNLFTEWISNISFELKYLFSREILNVIPSDCAMKATHMTVLNR